MQNGIVWRKPGLNWPIAIVSIRCTIHRLTGPEEDPDGLVAGSCGKTTRETLAVAGVSGKQVAAVGVSCTNGLLAVDKEGTPLLPAILMLDQRSNAQAEWIRREIGEERVFSITGNRVAPGAYSAPIMRWILEERPELYKRVHKFLVPTGFYCPETNGKLYD